jgi:hypothetical protein
MDRRNALKRAGLLGAAVAMPTMLTILQSCKNEPRLSWKPEFFSDTEAKTIAALLDMMLPRTETPGALDVKADVFIDKVIAQTYGAEGQQHMRDEIARFNAKCMENYQANFIDLDEPKRIVIIKAEEKSSGKFSRGIWGKAIGPQEEIGFYRSMKSMAIWAYFTSEEIGEKVLSYDPIPGAYEACKPLAEVGNRWSL